MRSLGHRKGDKCHWPHPEGKEVIYIWYIFMDMRDGGDIYMVYIHGCKGRE